MALNFLSSPQTLMPAYNPVVFTFSGSNNINTGYRYLVDIYSGNSTNVVARLKVTPTQYGDGYVDISRILNNLVSVDFQPTTPFDSDASNSLFQYSVKLGEEYMFQWPYNIVTSASTGPYTRQVILSGITTGASQYVAGDQIEVITTSTGATSVVNGLHTVVTSSTNSLILDIIYPSILTTATTLNVSGNTTYADRRNIQYSGLTNLNNLRVFNGAMDWVDYSGWIDSDYDIRVSTPSTFKQLLTSLNFIGTDTANDNRYYATPSQNFWFNFYTTQPTSAHTFTYQLINKDGSVNSSGATTIINTFSGFSKQFRIGFETLGFTPTEGQRLRFVMRNSPSAATTTSKTYIIYADTRCKRESINLYYMDRMGSILSQAFTLNSTEAISIERDTIKKAIIYPSNNNSLDLTQAGSTNVNVDVERNLTLQSNWLTQANIDMMEELISSRYVWIEREAGIYLPVVVQDAGYEVVQQRNKRLQRKTVIVQLANQQPIN